MAKTSKLVLYHTAHSTCSQKVRMVLHEKALQFDEVRIDLAKKEQLKPDYLAINPNGVVPTLLDDGVPIIESSVICEYLDEKYAENPLVPSDIVERARMRAIDDLCDRTFDATVFGYFLGVVRSSASEAEAMKDAGRAEFKALLARLER